MGTFACTKGDSKPEAQKTTSAASEPAPSQKKSLVVYSGRKKSLVGPLLEKFEAMSGIDLQVKYGKTAALAAALLEEHAAGTVRADVFFAQDAGGLGLLTKKGLFQSIPGATMRPIDPAFRAQDNTWVGVSGRVRTVVYNTDKVKAEDLPTSLDDLTKPKWKGRVGWAPANASFQAHVTALRVTKGEAATKAWLLAMQANEPKVYPKNTPIVEAAARGEIDVGLVNHYYLHKLQSSGQAKNAANHYMPGGETMVNVAGVGALKSAKPEAMKFVQFLLSDTAQQFFASQTFEYPLLASVKPQVALPQLADIEPAEIDLSSISDLEGTLALLRETKVLQ